MMFGFYFGICDFTIVPISLWKSERPVSETNVSDDVISEK